MYEVDPKAEAKRRLLLKLSLFATAFAMVVVVLGAFTRLVDAGLGCPDWPGCYGHLTWPTTASEVEKAEALFPEAPVEHDKTWPEMVHRYFAGVLGLIVLAILIIALRGPKISERPPIKLPVFLAIIIIVQAAFGMWTVTLKLWPQVVTAHLLGGFMTLSLIWLMAQRCSRWHWQLESSVLNRIKPLVLFGLAVLIIQIALGGWTTSNYAAMACPDLPTCHGEFWPEADYVQGFNIFQEVGPNYLGGQLDNHARTAIHMAHRIGALLVTCVLLVLALRLWFSKIAEAQHMSVVLAGALTLQVVLGLSNVYWVLPLPVAVAHNAVGAILLLVLVTLSHRIYTAKISTHR